MNVIVEVPTSGLYFGGPTQRRHLGGTHWEIIKAKPRPKKVSEYKPNWDVLSVRDEDDNELARYQPGNWRAVWREAETPAPEPELPEVKIK